MASEFFFEGDEADEKKKTDGQCIATHTDRLRVKGGSKGDAGKGGIYPKNVQSGSTTAKQSLQKL